MTSANPLVSDRDVAFLMYELFDLEALARLPAFAEHSKETFDLYVGQTRRFAREVLYPAYKPMDEAPPRLVHGRVVAHPRMAAIWDGLRGLGVIAATRPPAVGGQSLPMSVAVLAHAYLMAGNLAAYGFAGLTSGAAHLLEAFGDAQVKAAFMPKMYAGEWSGTMALTEPQAGSSLSDVTTRAIPRDDGTFAIVGSKIFISGGDHDFADNVVHMTLARIEGAPAGIKGISLFAVPSRDVDGASNDVAVAGVIHKIGWRGIPSLALSFGDEGRCRGWLVGTPNSGLSYMFQMMNEARIMVGVNGVATASVAYHESLAYARSRTQGRALARAKAGAPVPIIEHADVRRMLLRQKAIVEGGLALVTCVSRLADLAEHAEDVAVKDRSRVLLDALTPIVKSFPAEWGFESNALALQVHGGYGYSSEQLPEAWLRDQKLNTIHEGTTGIQALDLLGRRIVANGGAPLAYLLEDVREATNEARTAGLDPAWARAMEEAADLLRDVTTELGLRGAGGDVEGMLRHATDYLMCASIVVVAWLWLRQATVAKRALGRGPDDAAFYEGKLAAAQYWLVTELPRAAQHAALCRSNDDAYARMQDAWF